MPDSAADGRRARSSKGRVTKAAAAALSLLALLAGAAAVSEAKSWFSRSAPASDDSALLNLDYRGGDPGVYQYRDVAIGDVTLANPGLEIVRAGNRSSPTWGNVSVSRFSEAAGFENLTGFETSWQEFFRVETGQLRPAGPEEIVAVGKWSGDGGASYQATAWVINGTAPASAIGWKAWGVAPENSYFWAVAVGDVDLDGEVEFVAVGTALVAPGEERGLVVVANMSGGAMQQEHYALYNGSFAAGTKLHYWAVEIANLDSQPEPEIVIAGELRDSSFVQVANFTGGSWSQLRNTTYRTYDTSNVYMTQVADVDGNAQLDIVCAGKERQTANATTYARVSTFTWDGGGSPILPRLTRLWTGNNDDASAYDVVLEDLTADPGSEIATIGYNKNGTNPAEMWGELNVMNGTLSEIAKMQWNGSDTDHWGMSSKDVDGDGKIELVSVGMKGTSGIWEGETQVTEVPEIGPELLALAPLALLPLWIIRSQRARPASRRGPTRAPPRPAS
jgi:hypothetical protein